MLLSETRVTRLRTVHAGKDLGLRARHKLDKSERITAAAIRLFASAGYDSTTLRDIAREADVALGTLSLYARDKRDLVLMIFNKLIPPLFEAGVCNLVADAPLAQNAVAFFKPCYEAYAREVTLYRIVLGQIYNGPGSVHAEENDAIRLEVLGHLTDLIRMAVATGEVRADIDIAVQSRSFFYLYFTAVRVWLYGEQPQPMDGLMTLETFYRQHVGGIAAHD